MLNREGQTQKEKCCLFFFSCVESTCGGDHANRKGTVRKAQGYGIHDRKVGRGRGSRESSGGGDTETDNNDLCMLKRHKQTHNFVC